MTKKDTQTALCFHQEPSSSEEKVVENAFFKFYFSKL